MRRKSRPFPIAILLSVLLCISSMPFAVHGEERGLSVSARSAILICADDGRVVWEKNADSPMGMASTTKIMTALYALTICPDTERVITVSAEAAGIEGSSVYLQPGETLTLSQLLYAMMLQSANDAAAAIAIGIGGDWDTFVAGMNAFAADLGLVQTHFENPHGLDGKNHYTTARDLAMLTRFALANETFAKIVATKTYGLSLRSGERMLVNHNRLLREDERFYGVKTGYTIACGRCLVSAARQDGVSLIAVTLHAPDDWRDHRAMMELGFSMLERKTLIEAGELLRTIPVVGGVSDSVSVRNIIPIKASLPKGDHAVQIRYDLPETLTAPVFPGTKCGEAVIYIDGSEFTRLGLFARDGVKKNAEATGFWQRIKKAIAEMLEGLFGWR